MSTTVTFAVQDVELPAASATVTVTVVSPRPIALPAEGDWTIETTPTSSVAVTSKARSGTLALQEESAARVLSGG